MALVTMGPEWFNKGALTPLNDGTILALTASYRGSSGGYDLIGRILDADGVTIGTAFTLRSLDGPAELNDPVAVSMSNGRILIAWEVNTDGFGAYRLETQTFKTDGTALSGITQ